MNAINDLAQATAILSVITSFFVILTYILLPQTRKLRYVELVFYVSINDFFASIGVSLGETKDGSFACWFQGLTTNYNYLSALFWSGVIIYQVLRLFYSLVS